MDSVLLVHGNDRGIGRLTRKLLQERGDLTHLEIAELVNLSIPGATTTRASVASIACSMRKEINSRIADTGTKITTLDSYRRSEAPSPSNSSDYHRGNSGRLEHHGVINRTTRRLLLQHPNLNNLEIAALVRDEVPGAKTGKFYVSDIAAAMKAEGIDLCRTYPRKTIQGGQGQLIRQLLVAHPKMPHAEIAETVIRMIPGAKTNRQTVAVYATQLRQTLTALSVAPSEKTKELNDDSSSDTNSYLSLVA